MALNLPGLGPVEEPMLFLKVAGKVGTAGAALQICVLSCRNSTGTPQSEHFTVANIWLIRSCCTSIL